MDSLKEIQSLVEEEIRHKKTHLQKKKRYVKEDSQDGEDRKV